MYLSLQRSGVFSVLGQIVGRMVPRCTDPTIKVREEAILTIQTTLRIQLAYTGKVTLIPVYIHLYIP